MTRRVRIAIVGESPCELCTAACCKQNGHEYAVRLRGDEKRKFAAFAVDVPIERAGEIQFERVLPYVKERCQFLGADDRCAIYEDRPQSCREFQCVEAFNAKGNGRHGRFLELNPRVCEMLETL
jgi:Fe-S-cluster containining protein